MPIYSKTGKEPYHSYDTGDDSTLAFPTPTPEDGYRWFGKATPGTPVTSPAWQIRRIKYTQGEVEEVMFPVDKDGKASNLKKFVWMLADGTQQFMLYTYGT